jgi:Tol biopolymer transport system component
LPAALSKATIESFVFNQLLTNLFQASGRSSIWTVSAVGENPRHVRDDAVGYAVSPDGSRIAFITSAPNYDREIWTMSAQGGDPLYSLPSAPYPTNTNQSLLRFA